MEDHEFRYHNGANWTGDVATNGVRQVTATPQNPENRASRSGTTAMVLGIISMSTGWIPFVCFVAAFIGIAAVVIGRRRRHFDSAGGAATTGVVTGVVGVLLSAVGIWLSVVIVQTVVRFEDPGPFDVELTACDEVDGVTRATGEITNLDEHERSYTIVVSVDGDTTIDGEVNDVGAGERRVFRIDEDLRFAELDCAIDEVNGPRPFGLEP